jgi:hypothetical protein
LQEIFGYAPWGKLQESSNWKLEAIEWTTRKERASEIGIPKRCEPEASIK